MKIGILTLPLHNNYGGILQAYALQTVLERMGHEVVVFQRDYRPHYELPVWKKPFVYTKRIYMNTILRRKTPIFYEKKKENEYPIVIRQLKAFINLYIHTELIDKPSDISLDKIDCIVVGSDQIWRPKHFKILYNKTIHDAFLNFAKDWNGIRIAYGASFGVDDWEYTKEETEICRKLIKRFNAISVREDSGVDLCNTHLGVVAEHVLDPTLLLQRADYIKLIENANTSQNEGQLFCYILDKTPQKMAFVKKYAMDHKLKPYVMGLSPDDICAPIESRIMPSIEQWLRGFYDAEFVITDSFHGCVFSIIFNKRFIAIGNVKRGLSRFVSLLSLMGLQNHLITNCTESVSFKDETIDYENTLSVLRGYSLDFLKNSLKNKNAHNH